MKFDVKAVALDKETREQTGNIRTERIDTNTNELFVGLTEPKDIEKCYEAFWRLDEHSKEIVKVISINKVN